MDGITVGVLGTDQDVKAAFESSVAKKSEAEGLLFTLGQKEASAIPSSTPAINPEGYRATRA